MKTLHDLAPLVRRFIPYLRDARGPWIAAALLLALGPALGAALLWAVKLLIDDVFVGRAFDQLPWLIAIYLAIACAKVAASYATARLDGTVTERVAQNVRADLYRHAMSLSPGSLKNGAVGDLLTRLGGDAERVEYLIYTGLLGLCADLFGVMLFVGVLLALSWKLTLCALLIAPVLAVVSLRLAPRIRRASGVARRATASWMSLAEERLGASALVFASGAGDFETSAFRRRCDNARRAELRVIAVQAWSTALIEVVAVFGGLAVIVVGATEIQRGSLTVGTLIAFLGSIGSLYGPIGGLAKAPGRFQRAAARVQRVVALLDTPSLVAERSGARPLRQTKGRLEFVNVDFGYAPDRPVLQDVSLAIEPGESVALVGPSGGGKSSLVKLALRLHDPWSGEVRIDGRDLRDVTLASLREATAVVLQEPGLFRGSIAQNIVYEREPDPEVLASASAAAHVDGFAQSLRGGIRSPVGPRGEWLSGGQRQRIALARALYRDTPILLLDEATGALDSETEQMVQAALEQMHGRRTMLVVSHRLSSIRGVDRVVVLEGGRIVESGAPSRLLAQPSRFRQLFAAQLAAPELAA